MTLSERDKASIWHPYTQMQTADLPIAIVKGEGVHLFDDKGNKYIDAVSSWWVNIHGHAHPYIAEKVYDQLKQLEHVIFAGFTHPKAIELAEALLMKLPENQTKIFYSDNGSTAVEVALKMAFQYWQNSGEKRPKIIAFKNAYHGDTFGAMSVSGRSAFTKPFNDFLFDVEFIEVPSKGNETKSIESLISNIRHQTSGIAAFIFEPLVQGTAGMVMYEPEPLNQLLKICKENNILTIADEVMTGFGRTGKMLAIDHLTETPDIVCLSKGITGGTMALGVTSCSEEIYKAFLSDDKIKTFFHGHSYTANPIACSAALASLELFDKENTLKNIERISRKHKAFVGQNYKTTHQFRQQGTILAIELNTSENSSYFNSIRDKAYKFFLEKGIILRPLGNVIYVLPPYCINDEDLNYIYSSITQFINEL